MVRIEGPDVPYGTRYYRGGTVQFESSVGLLEAHEVEGDGDVSLEYVDPVESDSSEDTLPDMKRKKLGGSSVYHAIIGYDHYDLIK